MEDKIYKVVCIYTHDRSRPYTLVQTPRQDKSIMTEKIKDVVNPQHLNIFSMFEDSTIFVDNFDATKDVNNNVHVQYELGQIKGNLFFSEVIKMNGYTVEM